jgi:hypothetical protein
MPGFWNRTKPPSGVGLDWLHPLANKLTDYLPLNEMAGRRLNNLASASYVPTITGTPTWQATPDGPGVYCTGGASFDLPPRAIAAGDFTLRIIHRPTTIPANFTCLCDKVTTGGTTRELSVFLATNGDLDYAGLGGGGGTINIPTGMTPGRTWDFVLTRKPDSTGAGVANAYVNGAPKGSWTLGSGATGSNATNPLAFGRNPSGGGQNYNGVYLLVQLWVGRCLTAAEVAQLSADWYGLQLAPVYRRYALGSAAIITGTGALAVSRPALAATGAVRFVGTTSLSLARPAISASGAAVVQGVASPALAAPALSAMGQEVHQGAGGVGLARPGLTGTGAVVFGATGGLALSRPSLSGTGALIVQGALALALAHPTLSAAGESLLAGLGGITIGGPALQGSAAGQAVSGSGGLILRAPLLAATGAVLLPGNGALLVSRPSVNGLGGPILRGAAALLLPHPSLSSLGALRVVGTGQLALSAPSLGGSGSLVLSGVVLVVLARPAVNGTGQAYVIGTGGILIGGPTLFGYHRLAHFSIVFGAARTRYAVVGLRTRYTVRPARRDP